MNSVVRPLAAIYTGSTHPESFLVSYRRMSLAFSEGRGASVLRLVYSLPLACVAGVEKGRGREEGKKAGGLGTLPLLSSSMAGGWGGGLVCEQALYGLTELLRELARRLRGWGALGPS